MKDLLKRILLYVMILIIQIIINDFANLGPYLYICCIPLLVIYLPIEQKTAVSLLLAFGLGLLIDILSDGIIGLNAGSAVFLCMCRKPLFKLVFSRDNPDKRSLPTIRESPDKYIKYVSLSVFIYFLFYILFDGFDIQQWLFSLIRLILSCIINVIIISLVCYSFLNERK